MTAIKLLSKNKYLKVPLLYSGSGGNVPSWRKHLQPCEWLETDGNSFINTQLNSRDITTIKCKCYSVGEVNIFGARIMNPYSSMQLGTDNSGRYLFICDNSPAVGRYTVSDVYQTDILNFELNKNTEKVYFNSSEYSSKQGTKYTNFPLFLFGINTSGQAQIDIYDRIYYFETNLCNLIAAYVIDEYVDNKGTLCSAGVPGMVDTLTGVFYTNDGPGQFSHGGDIEI